MQHLGSSAARPARAAGGGRRAACAGLRPPASRRAAVCRGGGGARAGAARGLGGRRAQPRPADAPPGGGDAGPIHCGPGGRQEGGGKRAAQPLAAAQGPLAAAGELADGGATRRLLAGGAHSAGLRVVGLVPAAAAHCAATLCCCTLHPTTASPAPSRQEEIHPKNLLMIGPTGCGKTEIARRLAKMCGAPFVKVGRGRAECWARWAAAGGCCCRPSRRAPRTSPAPAPPPCQVEATKFTEVGFHGRDVDQIIRDLLDNAVIMMRQAGPGRGGGWAAAGLRRPAGRRAAATARERAGPAQPALTGRLAPRSPAAPLPAPTRSACASR